MIYKDRLRDLREENNMTQNDIGNIIEVDRKAYSHFETEYTILPIKHLNTLCNYFNVSIDYLFSFTNKRNYDSVNKEIDLKKSGERLKSLRKEKNLTQAKLAEILKSDNSTISKYEKGINIIATPFLYEICKKYHISADYLLGKIDHLVD